MNIHTRYIHIHSHTRNMYCPGILNLQTKTLGVLTSADFHQDFLSFELNLINFSWKAERNQITGAVQRTGSWFK